MITTREAINYQFSVIFGYSSPKDEDLIVGDVIGPGHLTKEKVKELSIDVIKFIQMYNAVLRDYTGSELFSIEFSLFNKDELQKFDKSGDIRIFPQSMILMPGKYKDCECILLALKPERDTLNVHKSREIVNKIGRLFSEIEEIMDRPELKRREKELVLQRFANRFGIKLYGEILEGKWNKKLIGLNTSLPTSKKMIHTYAATKSDVRILWHKIPHEINMINPKFEVKTTPYHGKTAIDHLKYSISELSANFIVENTVKLGTDLFNLCNTGTIDITQENFISFIIEQLRSKFKKVNENLSIDKLIPLFKHNLNEIKRYTNKFLEYSNSFIISGEKGDLKKILTKYKNFINKKAELENEDFNQLLNITVKAISHSIAQEKGLRVAELKSVMNYIKEIITYSYDIIIKTFPRYLSRRRMKLLTVNFVKKLKDVYKKEQKPSKILGNEYIDKFNNYFLNEIEIHSDLLSKNSEIDESQILNDFKHLIYTNLDSFFKEISLNIAEIVSFAKQDMETDSNEIEKDIESFKRFSGEIHYLLGYMMKYSTINRFLKEETDVDISDPVSFSNKFHRFLEKRIGGINLTWKSHVLDWMKDYAKQFFKKSRNTSMDLKEIYNDFLKFFEDREAEEQKPEEFLKFLRNFIDKISNEIKRSQLNEFYKQFEFCIELKNVFPELVKAKIKSEVDNLDLKKESTAPINFFSIDGKETFYQFIKESELKFFSKLIPRPLSIILKHDLSSEEQEIFSNSLFHIINFKFGHKHSKFYLADNFKSIYKEWEKEV